MRVSGFGALLAGDKVRRYASTWNPLVLVDKVVCVDFDDFLLTNSLVGHARAKDINCAHFCS